MKMHDIVKIIKAVLKIFAGANAKKAKPATSTYAPVPKNVQIVFYNEKGLQFGFVQTGNDGYKRIMNTSFYVGKAKSFGEKGGIVMSRDSNGLAQRVGFVSKEGIILDLDKGILPEFTHSETGNIPKSGRKEAEEITIGRVEVVNDVGVVYNKSGIKVGEVRGAGVDAKAYGGALLILLAEPNPKNAPYSHAFQRYETPAPPKGGSL
jgi:hypothetical protein